MLSWGILEGGRVRGWWHQRRGGIRATPLLRFPAPEIAGERPTASQPSAPARMGGSAIPPPPANVPALLDGRVTSAPPGAQLGVLVPAARKSAAATMEASAILIRASATVRQATWERSECREKCPIGKYGQDCRETCDCTNGGHCFHISGGCLCEAGFYGSHCEERKCLPGLYGLSCQFPCLCDPQHTQSCHPISGECACKAGWAGLYCNETCPHGSHGLRCQDPCLCLNGGTCDGETGCCSCPPGYTAGREWTVLPPALQAPGGLVATKPASVPTEQPVSPSTEDAPAWLGGKAANAHSHARAGSMAWDAVGSVPVKMLLAVTLSPDDAAACRDGKVRRGTGAGLGQTWGASIPSAEGRAGRAGPGPRCSQLCAEGLWGEQCRQMCSCKNGASCSPKDGICECAPGFRGPNCQRPCQSGRYGKKCSVPCKCANHSICHPVDGSCDCLPGWTGSDCARRESDGHQAKLKKPNDAPPLGSWKGAVSHWAPWQDWAIRASCGGVPTLPLNAIFWVGAIHGGNASNIFAGCTSGFFGNNCTSQCQCQHGALCDPGTGSCSCPSGYTGAHCETSRPDHPLTMVPALPAANPSLGAVIGIIILAALLAAVLVLFFCYRRCQKEKEKRHVSVAYTTGRTDSSEYVVPDVPPNYTHYYSNPSYHTLSPCSPSFTIPSSSDQPGKSLERDWSALHGADCNATLPSDWKHRRESPAHGGGYLDRSCSYMDGLGKYRCQVHAKEGPQGRSDSSLSSENPYATIKDCPGPAGKVPEGSYMDMKCPLPSSKWEKSYAEISPFEDPARSSETKGEEGTAAGEGVLQATPAVSPNHYDSPKNSHIPSHYDVPPVRHYPPSPPLRRQAR
ncbi:hypothetical protein E2320_014079 [Naja naja]|nr:hypothetical protein E2320_014079 [Naja naja]